MEEVDDQIGQALYLNIIAILKLLNHLMELNTILFQIVLVNLLQPNLRRHLAFYLLKSHLLVLEQIEQLLELADQGAVDLYVRVFFKVDVVFGVDAVAQLGLDHVRQLLLLELDEPGLDRLVFFFEGGFELFEVCDYLVLVFEQFLVGTGVG